MGTNDPTIYKNTMNAGWLCPLCELHGVFGNRQMMEKHLEWDHREVTVNWQINEVYHDQYTIAYILNRNMQITVILPEPRHEVDYRYFVLMDH
jgi:hypothetical protein